MKIIQVKISNILGIQHLEFNPDGFTEISGPNGQGKTSVLEAIKAATGQGHDATLLRKGAEKGEIVLVLEDGTEIQQKVTAATTTRNVVRNGKKVASPGSAIKALTDVLSMNPVEFLKADKKSRVKVMLESMPLKLDAQRLEKITGMPVSVSGDVHALAVIEHVRQQVYDDRTGTNRAITEKEGTINQLEVAMPEAPGGVEGNEDELRAQLQQVKDEWGAESKRIDTKLAGLKTESAARVQAIRDELQAKIDALRAEAQTAIDAENAALADVERRANTQRQRKLEEATAKTQPLQAAITAIVADRQAAAKRQATQETIKTMRQELEELRADAQRQTQALAGIDAYKIELLQSLPIPGLEVIDGEVYRDGIPFDRLNTAQRVGIAFEIAKLRSGALKVVCLDGMELLDQEHLDELERLANEADMQVFVTRVHGEEFSVETR